MSGTKITAVGPVWRVEGKDGEVLYLPDPPDIETLRALMIERKRVAYAYSELLEFLIARAAEPVTSADGSTVLPRDEHEQATTDGGRLALSESVMGQPASYDPASNVTTFDPQCDVSAAMESLSDAGGWHADVVPVDAPVARPAAEVLAERESPAPGNAALARVASDTLALQRHYDELALEAERGYDPAKIVADPGMDIPAAIVNATLCTCGHAQRRHKGGVCTARTDQFEECSCTSFRRS